MRYIVWCEVCRADRHVRPESPHCDRCATGAALHWRHPDTAPVVPLTSFATTPTGDMSQDVALALTCTRCGGGSVSALFYRGPDAHVCRSCGAAYELVDPERDRRAGVDRRRRGDGSEGGAEWRSGEDRRHDAQRRPGTTSRTPAAA